MKRLSRRFRILRTQPTGISFAAPSPDPMSTLQVFEEYQKARVKFVQAVAEAATRPQNIEIMNNAGIMQLLRPLLLDNVSPMLFVLNSFYLIACM